MSPWRQRGSLSSVKTYALDDVAAPPPALAVLVEEARRDGEDIVLTADARPVAKLIGLDAPAAEGIERKGFGSLPGIWMAPDFDEPLEDFKEYME